MIYVGKILIRPKQRAPNARKTIKWRTHRNCFAEFGGGNDDDDVDGGNGWMWHGGDDNGRTVAVVRPMSEWHIYRNVPSAEQNDFAINIDETSSVESGSNSASSMKTVFIVNRNLFSLDLIAVLARASTIHYR